MGHFLRFNYQSNSRLSEKLQLMQLSVEPFFICAKSVPAVRWRQLDYDRRSLVSTEGFTVVVRNTG
jgi:hypothetical protein